MGLRKKHLLVAPRVADPSTLLSLTARLAHYLAHLDVRRISIPVTQDLATSADWLAEARPPIGIDASAVDRIREIIGKTQFVATDSELKRAAHTSDVLAFWDIGARTSEPWRSFATRFRDSKTCFNIDWVHTRSDGRRFADIAALWASETAPTRP